MNQGVSLEKYVPRHLLLLLLLLLLMLMLMLMMMMMMMMMMTMMMMMMMMVMTTVAMVLLLMRTIQTTETNPRVGPIGWSQDSNTQMSILEYSNSSVNHLSSGIN